MVRLIHPIAGGLSLTLVALFWGATVVTELLGTQDQIVAVKAAIPYGFLVLVLSLAAAGGSGFARAAGRRGGLADAKVRRMPVIALNGLLVLIPSALFLSWRAQAGAFDTAFYAVQIIELAAGATNLTLLAANMRDGFRMTGRLRRQTGRA